MDEEEYKFEMSLRTHVRSLFNQLLCDETKSRIIEKSLKNSTFRRMSAQGLVPTFEDHHFVTIYKSSALGLLNSFKRNPTLIDQYKKGLIDQDIMKVSSDILEPDGPISLAMNKLRTHQLRIEKNKIDEDDYEGLFKCKKCGGKKTDYYQIQTRSADEPMTTYVTCKTCNTVWKF
jgi:DNA-directed RNA polymerase subunit M/transcription elongation factor TFIIS